MEAPIGDTLTLLAFFEIGVFRVSFLILGDIHGHWNEADEVISDASKKHPGISHIIQCGDLADGWDSKRRESRWNPKTTSLPIHWCCGNHENHDKLDAGDLNPRLNYQPRGSVIELDGRTAMFFGGAHSVDRVYRMPHVSWWPQEDITQEQLDAALAYEGEVEIMITHDRPDDFPWPDFLRGDMKEGRSNRVALQILWEKFRPRFWAHGHHHWSWHCFHNGTEMVSCPIIDSGHYTVYDGVHLFCSWWSPEQKRFFDKIERTDTCWLWRGAIGTHGYGNFYGDKVKQPWWRAHRYSYEYFCGDIPEGMVLDHLCRVRHCVRPDHLEPVTPSTNSLRDK